MEFQNYEQFFERQTQIPWLKQEKLDQLKVLILGIGGIGTNIAILCARLGIGSLFLVDNDRIEASNLNRQTLYSKNAIGKKKAEIAKKTLDELDNINSEIFSYDYDIFQKWQQTLELIEKSDIILNGLDQPEIKRTLIAIACYRLGKPMVYSGTDPHTGYSGMILYQSSKKDSACHECLQAILNSIQKEELRKKYTLKNITDFESLNWKVLEPKTFKSLRTGATTVLTAMLASVIAMNVLIKVVHEQKVPERIIFDLFNSNIEKFYVKKRKGCLVCGKEL